MTFPVSSLCFLLKDKDESTHLLLHHQTNLPAAMLTHYHDGPGLSTSGSIATINSFLPEVALVMVFLHSNRKELKYHLLAPAVTLTYVHTPYKYMHIKIN